MATLEQRIAELRARLAVEPRNTDLRASLASANAEYVRISQSLGGDRALGEDTNPAELPEAPEGLGGGVVPAGPPGCTPETTSFTQSTPVAIPTGPAVVTSTIVVSGVDPYLFDVNLITNIAHTFAADLDVTLTSPAGTVVTLTTDNGGGADNVFNGTLWDDDANPAGQVPYTTNNGLATDRTYVNLTTATPLVPEEHFGAFIGEDPNGTWTLTISDDLGGDGGNLASWSLELSTLPTTPSTVSATFTQSTPVAIPTGPAVVTSTIVVSGVDPYLFDLNMTTFMAHTWSDDLDVTLTSPAGTIVTITTDNGFDNALFIGAVNVFNGTLWDDDANPAGQVPYTSNGGLVTDRAYATNVLATPLVPEEAMAAFIGEDPNGTWTLTISDDTALDGGNLSSWSIVVTTASCCTITCPANVTQSNDPNQCGAVVTYPAPTTTGTCGTVTCSPPSGSFFPVGTTTVNCSVPSGSSCSFTVTINDTQPPTITCPANVTQANDANQCGAVVNYAAPTTSDNCPGATTTCSPPAGSFFPVGTTTTTCTATDAAGNTATCSFTVTVQDTQAPTIVCPANVAEVSDTIQGGVPGTTVTYPAPTVADNCPGVTVSCTPASGSFFPQGVTTVTCTATDTSPNSPDTTCTFTVTVTVPFNQCIIDDATGNTFSIVTDPADPLYRLWQLRLANGTVIQGTAEFIAYTPGHSLVAYDRDNAAARMDVNVNYGARTGTATVIHHAGGGVRYVVRDRNITNNPPCS